MHSTYDKTKRFILDISASNCSKPDKQKKLEDSKRKTTHHIQGNNNRVNN